MRKTVMWFFDFVWLKKRLYINRLLIFCLVLCFVLFVGECFLVTQVLAAPTNNHIDAILVMDTSGSMNDSDKDRVSIEAAKMFVDMMDINGSRVGMLGFSDTITPRIMMSDVSYPDDKDVIKKAIDNFSYQGYTDIGMALKQAQFIYENAPKSENSPVVLLFTDGNIEMNDIDTERTYEDSIKDINEVIKDAKGVFPIYTIGLNSDGSVDESLLQNISNATGGRCYVTNSPKDLPSIFNEIFADHIKSSIIDVDLFFSDGSTYRDVPINIPDNNVVEANIIIFSEKELLDTKIIDPSGRPLESENSKEVLFSKSSKYSIIKLLNPTKGDWILSVNGQKEDLIKVNLLFDYEIYVNMDVSPKTEVKEGGELKIETKLATNTNDIIDQSLSDIFDAYFIAADKDGNELDRIQLTPGAISGSFEAAYTIPKELSDKTLEIIVYSIVESDRVSRESSPVSLTIIPETIVPEHSAAEPDSENQQQSQPAAIPPTIKSEIKNTTIIYVPVLYGKAVINLSDHFENASDYSVSDSVYISSSIKDQTLTLTPKAQSNVKMTVTASNVDSETVSLSFTVSSFNILPYILIVLSIIAIVIFTYFFKKSSKLKNTLFTGNIRMVAIDSQGSYSPPELIDLSFTSGITNLRSLAQDIDNNTLPLNKILIYPGFDDKGLPLLGVINKSLCTITGDFDIKITDKKFNWYNNLSITIKDENNAEASVLELEYRN